MKIGDINLYEEVLVIAEIGNNHEGDYDRALEMIQKAAEAGAQAVKFQTIVPEKLVSVTDTARIEQLSRFQFSEEQFKLLAKAAEKAGVLFLSTPFDVESVAFLNEIMPAFKVASSDNDFYPLIEAIAKTGKPIIISSGLADMEKISKTESFIDQVWRKEGINQELVILHCVSCYPTAAGYANLKAIQTLQEEFGGIVGYSDHTLGIDAAVMAVTLGARIIEKHFTLDKNLSDFRDHQLSADPEEFALMVQKINDVQEYLGDGAIAPKEEEQEMVVKLRRSIIAHTDLGEGAVLTDEDISWVRPGGGVAPGSEDQLVGKKLIRPKEKGQQILIEDVEG